MNQLLLNNDSIFIVVDKMSVAWDSNSRAEYIKQLCGRYLNNSELSHDTNGRPYLKGYSTAKAISISHTKDYVAIIGCFKEDRCGIDIELYSRKIDHLSHKFTTAEELEKCSDWFPLNPYIFIWCVKEALYKHSGDPHTDFLLDLSIDAVIDCEVHAHVHNKDIRLKWEVIESESLVVVYTI